MCVVEIRSSFVVIDPGHGALPQKDGGSGGIGEIGEICGVGEIGGIEVAVGRRRSLASRN